MSYQQKRVCALKNKKSLIIISVLILTAVTFVICFSSLRNGSALISGQPKTKIVLDAGHGGIDGGVSGSVTGVKESQINLKIVKKLEKYLIDGGFEVILTRNSEAGLYGIATKNLKKKDMQKRKEVINKAKPSLVVSIHLNKYSLKSRRGAQVFYKEECENGKILAENLQNAFNELPQATRNLAPLKGDYYILNCSPYPSVIAECGYLSNPEEEKLLITEEYQDEISYTIFKGIIGYLNQTTV